MPIENEDDIAATSGVRPPKRRPELQTAPKTTGSFFGDTWQAVKLINVREDFRDIGEIPCARTSLMAGIASGTGIGVIRGVSVSTFAACNWAMGTFFVVSFSAWNLCRFRRSTEQQQMQQVRRIYAEKRRAAAAQKPAEDATPR
ncbi:hypothetical protein EXIGLDRAFT_760736 [Exidia glandulosa HHB12029]|uniref:Cytochrome c oxidase assembly protein COX20, mitochondrial n=1 Tax=Exidia glandulosa HHB12029 TaxID=1314781 RepID=A0A165P1X6_EXIGL|nr:hypothetical protein EXIGLDRAFT_760736 [Exidia glandulosa HHB12029]